MRRSRSVDYIFDAPRLGKFVPACVRSPERRTFRTSKKDLGESWFPLGIILNSRFD